MKIFCTVTSGGCWCRAGQSVTGFSVCLILVSQTWNIWETIHGNIDQLWCILHLILLAHSNMMCPPHNQQCLYPPPATTLHVTPHCNGVTQQVYCYTSSQAAAARDSSVAMGPRCHVITAGKLKTRRQNVVLSTQPARPLWLLRRRSNFTSTYRGVNICLA